MGARQVELELLYDDKDITRDIWQFVESFVYVDRTLSDKMDELSLTLQDVAGLWSGDWYPQQGAKFGAKIKVHNWFNPDDFFELDCGTFEIDDLSSSGFPSIFTIAAISVGITNKIRWQQNSKMWNDINLEDIAKEIAQKHNFGIKFYSKVNPIMERWEQKSESDLAFLKRICEFAGFTLKITGENIVIFNGEEFDSAKPEITIHKENSGIKQFDFNSNSNDIYSACEVMYYDSQKDEFISYIYIPDEEAHGISGKRSSGSDNAKPKFKTELWVEGERAGESQTRQIKQRQVQTEDKKENEITEPKVGKVLRVNARVTSIDEAINLSKSILRKANMRMMTGNIRLMGRPDLYSGMTVNIKGFGIWDSVIWSVEEVSHEYAKSGGYNSSVKLRGILGY